MLVLLADGCGPGKLRLTDNDTGAVLLQFRASSVQEQGVVLDRLLVMVNGDVILESDGRGRRFEEVSPTARPVFSREDHRRLIDRTLFCSSGAGATQMPSQIRTWMRSYVAEGYRHASNITARRLKAGRNIWDLVY
jgi:hypothetical protein